MRGPRAIALLATLCLGGCGAAQDRWTETWKPAPVYDKPVGNVASRAEPFVNRMRTPVPDRAWVRESSSEVEPWTVPPRR